MLWPFKLLQKPTPPALAVPSPQSQTMLFEATTKALKEQELKTLRLSQELHFPLKTSYASGHIQLAGHKQSGEICSGDWWFYFQSDHELWLVIAEAPARGLVAALMLATARTYFSSLRGKTLEIRQVAEEWDRVMAECSGGKIFTSASLLKIDVELGDVQFLNVGQPGPVHLQRSTAGWQAHRCDPPTNVTLGRTKQILIINQMTLAPGDRLFLFTPGLSAHIPDQVLGQKPDDLLRAIERSAKLNTTLARWIQDLVQNSNPSDASPFCAVALEFKGISSH